MNKKKEWFPSFPGGWSLILFFAVGIVFCIWLIGFCYSQGESYLIPVCVLWIFGCVWVIYISFSRCACYIRLSCTYLECIYPFKKITLRYSECTVGMDYSWVRGSKLWWIYLCYGPAPRFAPNAVNRINAMRCKEGFVRILYCEQVYEELLKVLPKKQATALITAKRCIPDLGE